MSPISKYNPNTTIFHYGSTIRTESYKIREFKNSRHVAQLATSFNTPVVSKCLNEHVGEQLSQLTIN